MNDDRIRDLLHDAVADVEPRRGVQEIRTRTKAARSHRSWAWGAGGAITATAATIAAVAFLGGSGDRDAGPAPAGAPAWSVVPVYYVGDTGVGPRLFEEPHARRTAGDEGRDAVQQAVDGDAFDPDYRSDWPAGTRVNRVTSTGDSITVDLSGADLASRPSSVPADAARISLQQVVATAQDVLGQTGRAVTFTVDGSPADRLLGVALRGPVAADAPDDVLAPVSIGTPADMRGRDLTPLPSPVTVSGRASAFEANVQWELMRGDTVVRSGFTTARECCTLSPYSFRFTAPPGEYTLVVHEEDASGGEGTPSSVDTKRIVIG